MSGTVKFFDDAKGYGFIIEKETKKEYFVHFTGIQMEGHKTLKDGQEVSFEILVDENTGKTRAINVK